MDALVKRAKLNKLKGKVNYTTWVPGVMMELRKDKVVKLISQAKPISPEEIEESAVVDKVKEWLAETNEVPEAGFSTAKVNGNKALWRKSAQDKYDKWMELNDVALEIIYSNCDIQCQATIKEDTIAKEAWERLEKAYSQTGFASIVEQTTAIRSLSLDRGEGESLDKYTNKWKEVKSTLDAHGLTLPEDIWSGLYLAGLDESFRNLTRDLMNREIKTFTFEQTIQSAFNEKLAIEATSKKEGNNYYGQANAYNTNNKDKELKGHFCKRCDRRHGKVCWKENPEMAPQWYRDMTAQLTTGNNKMAEAATATATTTVYTRPSAATLFGQGQGYVN
jgi:hypothetical protein